ASAVADPARAGDRVGSSLRDERARRSRQGPHGRTPAVIRISIAALVMAAAVGVIAQEQPPAQQRQPSFRIGVELVSLNVTVTDGAARYVTDLETAEFNVFEDGVKQDVTFFNKTNLPIALAILLDTSASMETKLQTAQDAA